MIRQLLQGGPCAEPWPKIFVTQMRMRDQFAVANLLVQVVTNCRYILYFLKNSCWILNLLIQPVYELDINVARTRKIV